MLLREDLKRHDEDGRERYRGTHLREERKGHREGARPQPEGGEGGKGEEGGAAQEEGAGKGRDPADPIRKRGNSKISWSMKGEEGEQY